MIRSLRARLFAAVGLIAILSLALAFAIGAVLTRRAVERNTLRDVAAQADLLFEREKAIAIDPFGESSQKTLAPLLKRQRQEIKFVQLGTASPYLSEEDVRKLRDRVRPNGTRTIEGTRYFYAARPVPGRPGRAFVLLRPTELVASAWRPHLEGLLIGALAAAALAGLGAFFLARAISRPVRRVAEASRSLTAERSPHPVPVEGASELASLAESFNEMAAQLAKAKAAERSFLLSVSHELKTPLTAIRGYAEGLDEGVLPAEEAAETIRREASRLERLVRDLLDLARMNRAEFGVRQEPVDLALAAHEVVRRYEPQARSFGVSLDAAVQEPARAIADADRTLQVVSNLVENALRYTPRGGLVRVVAEPGTIRVEDTGPGLRPEDLPHAFDRFYLYSRYGDERPVGTGLGLAIVKELTRGMNGTVSVSSELGRGTRFTVRLPAAPSTEPAEQPDVFLTHS